MKRVIPIRWDQIELDQPGDRPRAWSGSKLSWLRRALTALPVGTDHNLVYEGRTTLVYQAAKMLGCRIQTRKLNGIGIKIWRLT